MTPLKKETEKCQLQLINPATNFGVLPCCHSMMLILITINGLCWQAVGMHMEIAGQTLRSLDEIGVISMKPIESQQ